MPGKLNLSNMTLACSAAFAIVAGCGAALAAAPEAPSPSSAPGAERTAPLEKMVALMVPGLREDQWNREGAKYDYVHRMSPNALEITKGLDGYTTNLVHGTDPVFAVTEVWTHSIPDLLDPEKSMKGQDSNKVGVAPNLTKEQKELQRSYIVEERVVKGGALTSPLVVPGPDAKPTAGVKVVWLFRDAARIPPPPAGAYRVTDSRVLRQVGPNDTGGWEDRKSDIVLIRMAWGRSIADLGDVKDGLVVDEYRWRDPK